ncbi:DUF1223 domain-containing protein [Celeribacter litoreus]|uniref:DUF1223 domain-containing protein n=1 Tax=Celeribacter litoreus TaxID=2876714 RepID=UPI001CCAEA06|nr:DUF1223 domain-containing protein [Celeribacter litoreus]MCA0044636.1 DUF1223 domain-containing protein [Celeribacter litoreus]
MRQTRAAYKPNRNRVLARITAAFIAAVSLFGATDARAESADDTLVVVELFTSQGCSSCPPADAMIAELATREGILPLSLHVDYWDYIGWRDHFAQPQFTERQKAYAHAAGKRSIYTPQMIVQGAEHVVGVKPMRLGEAVMRFSALPELPVMLGATRDGDKLMVSAVASGPLPPAMRVQLVRFNPHERVMIERGENAGKTVDYTNIVTQWTPIADWTGAAPLAMTVNVKGEDHTAIILQAVTPQGPGPILAAVRAE